MNFQKIFYILVAILLPAMTSALTIDRGAQEWPPYTYNGEEGDQGIMIEVFEKIAKKLGHETKVVALTEERGKSDLELENIDVRPKAKEWVANADSYQWTDTVLKIDDIIVYPKNKSYTSIQDLKGKILAVVRGYTYPELNPYFDGHQTIRSDANDTLAMLRTVSKGHSDAAVTNRDVFYWYKKNNPKLLDNLLASTIVVGTAYYRFQFPANPKYSALIKQFNVILGEMKKKGEIERIISKYR